MFVAHLVSDKEDEFSGLEGLCVQLVALRFTRNITGSRGLNLLSVSLSLCITFCGCLSLLPLSYDVH